MAERETIAFRINQSTKEEWRQYAEENPQTENLSQLVRLAVRREINDSHDTQQTAQVPQMDSLREDMSELLEGFGRIEDRLTGVESRLNALEREAEAEGPKYGLQKAVFESLPSAKEVSREEQGQPHEWAATAEELAESVNGEVSDVEEALDSLEDTTSQVVSVSGEKGTFYYKRE